MVGHRDRWSLRVSLVMSSSPSLKPRMLVLSRLVLPTWWVPLLLLLIIGWILRLYIRVCGLVPRLPWPPRCIRRLPEISTPIDG
jgi:hypothetical protein